MAGFYKLRCALVGHEKDVRAVAPSIVPEGGVISGSRDITSRLWVPNDFNASFTVASLMRGHRNFVSAICVMPPDDEYPHGLIVTGSNDSTILVYTVKSPVALYKLEGHSDAVCALAAGKYGTLLSASWDKTAKVWLNRKCVMTLEGHTLAVWAVALMPDRGIMLTGSADRTIRLWRAGKCELIFQGHTDCVRSLAVLSAEEFVSGSNDASVRRWSVANGDCLQTYYGHNNYVYGVVALPANCTAFADFASVGEDRTLRVWSKASSTSRQTIAHPATSVWCVCCLQNGDLVTGSSDGVVRVFTTSPELMATTEELQAFDALVASSVVPQQIGDLNPDSLPGPESLEAPGPSDGYVKMIREGTCVVCYQWNDLDCQWQKVGDVVGSSGSTPATSGKTLHNGKEYDYVFTVDIKEGELPLKLPYNVCEDPWWAAQKFIDENNLSQLFLDQVANFIVENTKTSVMSQVSATAPISDPFTGGGRYIPGAMMHSADNGAGGADPFTGSSRYAPSAAAAGGSSQRAVVISDRTITQIAETSSHNVPSSSQPLENATSLHFPQKDVVTFEQANINAIIDKAKEFSAAIGSPLSGVDLDHLMLFASSSDANHVAQYTMHLHLLWERLTSWPSEKVFPLLDILRLAIRSATINEHFCNSKDGAAFVLRMLAFVGDRTPANQMLALRTLCNAFQHRAGYVLMEKEMCTVLDACTAAAVHRSPNKNVQVALGTLLLNYAIALHSCGSIEDRSRVLSTAVAASNAANDPEAQFRLLVCIGTLTWKNEACTVVVRSLDDTATFVARCRASDSGKVRECAAALSALLVG